MSKVLEKIIEPDKIYTGSEFLLKIKVERVQSKKIISEIEEDIVTESGENFITEGDFYE